MDVGYIHMSIFITLIGVISRFPKAESIREVRWNVPLLEWIKCNIDGSIFRALGLGDCRVFFLTCRGFTKGCFSNGLRIHSAFEAEMMGFLLTIVKAAEFSRSSILIKVNSTYVFNLFINGSGEIPWQVHNRWFLVCKIARALRVVVSHNFQR